MMPESRSAIIDFDLPVLLVDTDFEHMQCQPCVVGDMFAGGVAHNTDVHIYVGLPSSHAIATRALVRTQF